MEQYKGQIYLEHANEIATKGRLLGDTYCLYLVADMIQSYLSAIGMGVVNDEEFNNMTTEIIFAEKQEIYGILKKYGVLVS